MKIALCFAAFLGTVLALPAVEEIDWTKIQPRDVSVEPLIPSVAPGSKIINGQEATANSIPYQVGLIIDGSGFCGGSLITANYVLTAAHCTSGAKSIQVILGAHRVQSTESTQQRITSTTFITHTNYSPSTIANDVALIKLPTPAQLNQYVATVTLATSGTFDSSSSLLTGWGRTSDSSSSISPVLMRVDLSTITNTACSSYFGSYVLGTNICTSGTGPKGACNGDSGGPLVVSNQQVGIVSFGSSVCAGGSPTVYTRVTSFITWIKQNSDLQ